LGLVLDGVDGTLSSPVLGIGKVALIEEKWLGVGVIDLGTKHLLGLLLGHGGEHVVAESERALSVVPELDLVVLLSEDLESVNVLLFGTEAEAIGVHVSLESLMKLMSVLFLLVETEAEHSGCLGKVHHLLEVCFCFKIIMLRNYKYLNTQQFQNISINERNC